MKRLITTIVSFLTVLVIFAGPSAKAAGVNDFVINSFNADYVLTSDAPGGRLVTTEDIDLTYSAYNHGILRAIPESYKDWNTKLKIDKVIRDGVSEPYSTYEQNGNLVLKIGDAGKTITGHHTYEIVYEQKHVVNFSESAPEFFWDVTGTEWSQPFGKISATVHLPASALSDRQPACFTGSFGSAGHDCVFNAGGDQISFETNRTLNPGENMTIAVPLKDGVFTRPAKSDFLKDNMASVLIILMGMLIAGGAAIIWFMKGRDYAGRGVIIPQYEPPQNVDPAEVGLLYDYKVDSRDMTAMLINLAIKRYVRLHEDKKKILFFASKSYKVELLNNDFSALRPHEKRLLDAIFSSTDIGAVVEMNKISKPEMGKAVEKIRKNLQEDLTSRFGYFEKDAKKLGNGMTVAGFIILFGSFFLPVSGAVIGGIVGGLALIIFGRVMPRRSHAGTESFEHIKGMKLYMDTAEKDRLKMMQSVDRPYAEPSKTVEFYEKLLPYAIALGVEKSWTKQFEGVLNQSPDWYSGYTGRTFTAAAFASGIGGVNSSFSSSFASSGSGGGGFSGGGGGGGGGGGW